MKHRVLKQMLATMALLLCSMVAMAETVTVNGITYDIIKKAKLATVVASESDYTGSIVIPETVEYDGVAYSVTAIGYAAFRFCYGLTSVTIPNSVTTIGSDAFSGCTVLTAVHISDLSAWCNIDFDFSSSNPLCYAHNLYLNGNLVTDLVIPDDITEIKKCAFYGCSGLTSVTIPNSVTEIGYIAFSDCTGLTAVHISDLSAWCNIDFDYSESNPLYYAHNLYLNGNLVTDLVIPDDITEIKKYAFYGCSGLKSVTIGNGVTTIGQYAFEYCSNLTSVTIPNSVTTISDAFRGCTGLTSVTIPNSVTTISGAFDGCTGLTSVTIPNSVTTMSDAFRGCTGLTSITIGDGVTTIGSSAFSGCTGLETVVIGEGVKTINFYAFVDCENLTDVYCLATSVPTTNSNAFENSYIEYATLHVPEESIDSYKNTAPWSGFGTIKAITNEVKLTYEFNIIEKTATVIASNGDKYSGDIVIPETVEHNGVVYNVTAIGEFAFNACTDLTSINLGNGVTTIGEAAFWNCDGLTNVVIGDGVTEIGNNAFQSCDVLTSITIPNSVTVIGAEVFLGCTELTSIVVESGNTKYDSRDGCNAIIETVTNTLIAGCNNTVIPEGVTRIGSFVFAYCTGLTNVTIPNSVTTIGEYAFLNCDGLTSVTIGNSVTTIGEYAFYGCTEISDIYSYITTEDLFSISNNTFDVAAYENATLHVPFGTAATYSMFSAWNKFVNIVEDDTMPMSLALVYNGVLEYASSILDDTAFGSHGLITSEAQLSTNAQEPTEGPIANLLDNDFMTYFHSTWSATNTSMAYHYLQIDLGEPLDAVALKYSKRTGTGFMVDGSPVKVRVFATNDTNGEWNEVGIHRLNYTHAADTVAVGYKAIVLDNSYRHIRLQVEQTVSNKRDKNNLYFNLSEIGAWEARFEEEHVAYKDVPSNLMNELKAALSDAKSELMAGNDNEATAGRLYDAFEAVKNYVPTGIEDVFDENDTLRSNLYYDLQGRVVEQPTRGIYIHNGKKVFIK